MGGPAGSEGPRRSKRWRSAITRLRDSLNLAIGDIAFGMEDGAVSIAGLVFGVAASTNDRSIVLLAGAAGAVAGAVSMMAGTYLDVQSERHRAEALVAVARDRIALDPAATSEQVTRRLLATGFSDEEVELVARAFARNPDALLDHVIAFEIGIVRQAGASPWTHAIWMFVADLLAAVVPVVPFALFDIGTARIVSLVVTGAMMALLGIARGIIGHVNIWWTAVQTMAIAGAAALAGVVIGRLVSA
jgi:VIT1/CCC1 family predicted Fe2+/Mn2+ transporter